MKGLEELQPAWALPGFASGSSSFIPGMLGSRSSPGAGLPSWASCWSWENLGKVTLSVGRGFSGAPAACWGAKGSEQREAAEGFPTFLTWEISSWFRRRRGCLTKCIGSGVFLDVLYFFFSFFSYRISTQGCG